MFFRNIGYSRLVQIVYRNFAAIKIQRWWKYILTRKQLSKQTIDYDVVLR